MLIILIPYLIYIFDNNGSYKLSFLRKIMHLRDFLKLLRVEQWYKNVVIFIPIIFSFNLFNPGLFFLTILGLVSLCFISSSYYIINDIVDLEKDKNHPEKKNRPLASGRINIFLGLFISLVFLNLSLVLAYFLSPFFLLAVLSLFVVSNFYNFYIRNIAFLDIIFISVNFVIRT